MKPVTRKSRLYQARKEGQFAPLAGDEEQVRKRQIARGAFAVTRDR
jgi:hypothetical protein